jgi:O-antigen ligase
LLLVAAAFLAQLHDGGNTTLGGLMLAASEATVLLLLMIAPWPRKALTRGSGDLLRPGFAFAFVLLVTLWSMTPWTPGGAHPAWSYVHAMGAATLDRSNTLFEFIKLCGLGCVFVAAYALGRADHRARLAIQCLVALGAAYAIWSLAAQAVDRAPGSDRFAGSFQSANTAATLFGALSVISVSLAVSAQRRNSGRHRTLSERLAAAPYWAAGLLFLACLFLTASRGGVIATAVALVAFFALEAMAGRLHIWPAVGGLSAALVSLVLQGPVLLSRIEDRSLGFDRAHMFGIYWRAFQASPLTGYGLGTFDLVNKLNLTNATFADDWTQRAAHNVYLQWLLEAGLIGAAPMFACVGLVLFGTWRGVGRRRRATSLIRGLMAASLVFLVHGWTDFALQVPAMAAMFALLLGLQLGLANGSSTESA